MTSKPQSDHGKWQALDQQYPGVWHARYRVPNFNSNAVAIQSADSWLIYSPGPGVLETFSALQGSTHQHDSARRVDLLLPNHWHHLGLPCWRERYPEGKNWCSAKARKRLKKLYPETTFEVLEDRQTVSDERFLVRLPPGHRGGDVWLCQKELWVVCDSFLNYARLSNQPVARFLQKALGAAPGLKMSAVVRHYILNDRANFRRWLEQELNENPPLTLLPSHGEVFRGSTLKQELSRLASQL